MIYDNVRTKTHLLRYSFRAEVHLSSDTLFPSICIVQASPSQRHFFLDTQDVPTTNLFNLKPPRDRLTSSAALRVTEILLTNY